jgi:uncharacterized protein (DUF427 family)
VSWRVHGSANGEHGVPRADIDESALTFVEHQTFCPYKGLCSYFDIGDARLAAWSYTDAYREVGRISYGLSKRSGTWLDYYR